MYETWNVTLVGDYANIVTLVEYDVRDLPETLDRDDRDAMEEHVIKIACANILALYGWDVRRFATEGCSAVPLLTDVDDGEGE